MRKGETSGELFGVDKKDMPLSVRMRPQNLSEFIGQRHILGEDKLLRRAIEADRISSIILYGPPGCGKTALSQVIAKTTRSHFRQLNAVTSCVAEVREVLLFAQEQRRLHQKKTILLVEEIHRFNKPQQDALLPDVEEGNISLIGTTTLNPFFNISSPLLSRSQIFQLYPLSADEIRLILKKAISDKERGLSRVKIEEEALEYLVRLCEGDARGGLNALEIAALTTRASEDGYIHLTLEVAQQSIQQKTIVYDRDGDGHYDTISAFIKSMRGSDPDAALYWLAKMISAGEDPRFIARRVVICAAEDVGNADPQALVVATSALAALEAVGLPEGRIPLAQAITYIATAPKSNAAYLAINEAMKDVAEERTLNVPAYLQDSHYPGAKALGYGIDYKYPHEYEGHFVQQAYLPEQKNYYQPTDQGYEAEISERLKQWRQKG